MAGLTKVSDSVIKNPRINPNLIIDGNFDHWFEGTSQTSSGYGSDTMWMNMHGGSTKTHSRQSFTVGETEGWDATASYYSRTIVSSVAGSSNFCVKQYNSEDVKISAGRKVTLSFRAKADSNKNISIGMSQFFGTGGSPSLSVEGIGAQKILLSSQWAKYTITVEIPSIVGKILGSDNNDRLQVIFWFDAGSDFNSRTANLGQQSGTFDIAQVKLELGDVATPFVAPDPQQELARVNRYFQICSGSVRGYTTTGFIGSEVVLTPKMRGIPTCSFILDGNTGRASSFQSFVSYRVSGIGVQFGIPAPGEYYNYGFTIKADARL